jgi:hypothetical protein
VRAEVRPRDGRLFAFCVRLDELGDRLHRSDVDDRHGDDDCGDHDDYDDYRHVHDQWRREHQLRRADLHVAQLVLPKDRRARDLRHHLQPQHGKALVRRLRGLSEQRRVLLRRRKRFIVSVHLQRGGVLSQRVPPWEKLRSLRELLRHQRLHVICGDIEARRLAQLVVS